MGVIEMTFVKKLAVFALVVICAAFAARNAGAADFAPEKFTVENGLLYMTDGSGKRAQFEGAEVVEEAIDGGKIYWLAADPNADGSNEGLYKDWKSGIYFFGGDGKFLSCLEIKDAQMSSVRFSPDGKQFVLDSGTYANHDYKLYTFDGFELKKTFYGMPQLIWLDPVRFAFTVFDTERGPRYKNADLSGWMSIVMYDTAAETLETIIEATATEDYMLESADEGELVIWKYSVKDADDWADVDKREMEEIKISIPAAG
jgi:hypothetical protein